MSETGTMALLKIAEEFINYLYDEEDNEVFGEDVGYLSIDAVRDKYIEILRNHGIKFSELKR